jgi:hypothetical protein
MRRFCARRPLARERLVARKFLPDSIEYKCQVIEVQRHPEARCRPTGAGETNTGTVREAQQGDDRARLAQSLHHLGPARFQHWNIPESDPKRSLRSVRKFFSSISFHKWVWTYLGLEAKGRARINQSDPQFMIATVDVDGEPAARSRSIGVLFLVEKMKDMAGQDVDRIGFRNHAVDNLGTAF